MTRTVAALLAFFALLASSLPPPAGAFSAEERCEAIRMAAMGARISSKLQCRAWAKLTDAPVQRSCLDAADRRFLRLMGSAPECGDAGNLVDMGAAADAVMSEVVGSVDASGAPIPDISGRWELRTVVGLNPDRIRDGSFECDTDPTIECPSEVIIVTCEAEITQDGDTFHQAALCRTPPESPVLLDPFEQVGDGSIDPLTGECILEGEVEVPPVWSVDYKAEGVYAADGRSSTTTTTAGTDGNWLWLSVTTGTRLD